MGVDKELESIKTIISSLDKRIIDLQRVIEKGSGAADLNSTQISTLTSQLEEVAEKTRTLFNLDTSKESIESAYSWTQPTVEKETRYAKIRKKSKELALLIEELCPSSREKMVAQIRLQESKTWANESISALKEEE